MDNSSEEKMEFPRYLVLGSTSKKDDVSVTKYLKYVEDEGEVHGFLQFSEDEVISPYAKMQVVEAMEGNGLVHLRCCYNNRYWARNSSDENWITCSTDKKEEDQTKWSCTLFKPVLVSDSTIRFIHVQLGLYLSPSIGAAPFTGCLSAGPTTGSEQFKFEFGDWESLVIMPKYVAFKGFNGKYLSVQDNLYLYLDGTDIGNTRAGFEIVTMPDGKLRIKSLYTGKFWQTTVLTVQANYDENSPPMYGSIIQPVKLDTNLVALFETGSLICVQGFYYAEDEYNPFLVGSLSIENRTKLIIEELVISRQIYNVNFRLSDARIYNESVITAASQDAINGGEEPNEQELTVKYEDKQSSMWKCSLSLKVGVKTTIETGIPKIAEGKIEISAEFQGGYEWGGAHDSSSLIQSVYRVKVPPKTTVKLNLVATRGTCDVPFSYTQRDVLTDGRTIIQTKHDGIYTAVNSYNFHYETKQID